MSSKNGRMDSPGVIYKRQRKLLGLLKAAHDFMDESDCLHDDFFYEHAKSDCDLNQGECERYPWGDSEALVAIRWQLKTAWEILYCNTAPNPPKRAKASKAVK